jgi:O-antigen ligase
MSARTRSEKLIAFCEQALLLGVWLVLIHGLFSPWENFVNPQGDALGAGEQGSPISHAISIASYAGVALLFLCHVKGVIKTLLGAWPILVLCGWAVVSVAMLHEPGKSGVLRFLLIVLLSGYVAYRYDTRELVGFLTRATAIALLASLAVMVAAPHLGYSNIGGGYQGAWRGAFTHKNWLGSAMSFGIIVAGYSYIVRANHRLLSGVTFLGCVALLLLSRSATSLISTVAAVFVVMTGAAIQSRRAPVLRIFALLGLGIAVLVLMALPLGVLGIDLSDVIQAVPKLAGRSSDLTGRTGVWHAVWKAIGDRPFMGYGYGFWDQPSVARANIWLSADWTVPHAHNNWLDAWLQLGIVGVLITALIWIAALGRAMGLVFARYGHGALFYLTILVSCLARSAVETTTFAPALLGLFWWVIAYIYTARMARERSLVAREPPREAAHVDLDAAAGRTAAGEAL